MQNYMLNSHFPVYVGGSRSVNYGEQCAIQAAMFSARVVRRLGLPIHVGCCTGIDLHAQGLAPAKAFHIFAQFARWGQGSFASSAVRHTINQEHFGAKVSYQAGGAVATVPIRARLIKRSLAALAGCSVAVFFKPGNGSISVAKQALILGIPVLVWCKEPSQNTSPLVGASSHTLVQFLGTSFWLYDPKVKRLFGR